MRTLLPVLTLAAALAGTVGAAEPTPQQIADRLEARMKRVPGYECVMTSEFHLPKRSTRGTYHIWFRQPDLIRIKVTEGDHRGSEFAVTPNGKVRARGGGLARIFKITMSKTDGRLKSPLGDYAWESDFCSYCRTLRDRLQAADRSEVHPAPGAPGALQLSLGYRHPKSGHTMREVWTVDTDRWLLLGKSIFDEGREISRVQFRDFRENPQLAENFFDL
jgi:outer membrane lipoprotein-sorting protein